MALKTILFSLNAGSTLYGLDVAGSDKDKRGIFVGKEPNIFRTGEVDSLYLRLDRALESVAKSTQTLEMFYAPQHSFSYIRQDFYHLAMGGMARNLIDSRNLYDSFERYVIKHMEIGAGLRLPKKVDAKNNLLFAKYGMVPKGFVHAIRAALSVTHWLQSEFHSFPSNFAEVFPREAEELKRLKSNPENFNPSFLLPRCAELYAKMKDARAKVGFDLVPTPEYVNFILKTFKQEKFEEVEKSV